MTVSVETRVTGREAVKSDRVPVGYGNKLEFTQKDPAYVYRLVNDIPGRLAIFQRAGYEFVYEGERADDKGTAETSALDTRVSADTGGGGRGYLMRIKREFYLADQDAKIKNVRANEAAMTNTNPDPARGIYPGLVDD